MVKVHIWWPKPTSFAIGHASLEAGDVYISNWPGDLAGAVTVIPGKGQLLTFEMDRESEGRPPGSTVKIDGLSESDIVQWWREFKNKPMYNFYYMNCMQTVATALCVGSPNPLHTRYMAWRINNHLALYNFANSMALSPLIAGFI
jgi:hypothetical protein